jgi:hypothetical protein
VENILRDLDAIPRNSEDRRRLLKGPTGTLLHEVGHLVAAALHAGIPTDYLILDSGGAPSYHATRIAPKYYSRLEGDRLLRIKLLAAGYAAELAIFGETFLSRALVDLVAIAQVEIRKFHEDLAMRLALDVLDQYGPIFRDPDRELLKITYAKTARAVQSGRYRVGQYEMIPFRVTYDAAMNIGRKDRIMADIRTPLPGSQTRVFAEFGRNGGMRSGI